MVMVILARRSMLTKLGILFPLVLSGELFVATSAYAIGWDTLLAIAAKLPSLSNITKNIKDAANDVIATYDAVTLRLWKGELTGLRIDIIDLNSEKLHNLNDVQSYLDNKPGHKSWSALQAEWMLIPH